MSWGNTLEEFLLIMFQYDTRVPVNQHNQHKDYVVWTPKHKYEEPPF